MKRTRIKEIQKMTKTAMKMMLLSEKLLMKIMIC